MPLPADPSAGGLEFRAVEKSYGAVRALRGVSFGVARGDAHALVGENGAGKSTLLKILAALVRPDRGDIFWEGTRLQLSRPRDALVQGIGVVHQEMLPFRNLTVAGNIFAGREVTRTGGWLDERAMRARTRALLDDLHLSIAPDTPMDRLSSAHCQLVQIARTLAFDCRILVLDEPTTALTEGESDHLFQVLERLRSRGTTLLYVSHRLPEVFRLCNRITVLRDGSYVGTWLRATSAVDDIVRAMVGRDLPSHAADAAPAVNAQPPRLDVRALTRRPYFEGVSLSVRSGEIVGVFGLVGSGRSELLETIFGLHAAQSGDTLVDERPLSPDVRAVAARGVALVPEDRQRQGLFFNLSLRHNLMLPRAVVRGDVLVRGRGEVAEGSALLDRWRVRAPGIHATPDQLSGGNQQKVVVAKWLATGPRVLLLDEPTKGVDVGAKYEIHQIVRQQAATGMACLVVSSDLPELLALAHRIVVMRAGRVRGEVPAHEATEEAVMRLAAAEGMS